MKRRERMMNDLEQDIREHIEVETQDNIARGMSPEEAHYAAMRKFGNVTRMQEETREVWSFVWLEQLWQDVHYAIRTLARSPGFAAIVIVTLALGIGANTAIFSFIDGILLRSLPVKDPQQLVVFSWSAHARPKLKGHSDYGDCQNLAGDCSFSIPFFKNLRAHTDTFSGVAAFAGPLDYDFSGSGPASMAQGQYVSGDFFSTLGVNAIVGRRLGMSDDSPSAPPAIVLSYAFWQRAFGGDRSIVGRMVRLNNISTVIAGVAEPRFTNLTPGNSVDFFMPFSVADRIRSENWGHGDRISDPGVFWSVIVGRLKPGISLAQAQAAATAMFVNETTHGATPLLNEGDAPAIKLLAAADGLNGESSQIAPMFYLLMLAVALILLIACANVAGLMLSRSATRQREMAVRLALGAGRARITRQLLTESLILSVAGGVAGILLANWSVRSLVAFMSHGGLWPSHLAAHLDLRVLAFTAAASIFTGVLFGLAPTFRGIRLDLTPALKESPAALAMATSRSRFLSLGGTLVIAQVALAILVLSGAGLLVRTLQNLKSINPGFDTRNLLLFRMDPSLNGYKGPRSKSLYAELLARVQAIPGVLSATYSFDDLLSGNSWITSFGIEGEVENTSHATLGLNAGPKFFETMGIRLMTGRVFTPQDFSLPLDTKWEPAVINEAFARTFFKDRNPLGRRLTGVGHQGSSREIVGIVGDTKFRTLRSEIAPTLFVPAGGGEAVFEIRTAVDPRTIIPAVRSVVSQLDNKLPLFSMKTESEQIARSLFQERLIARLSSFFGALSLLLACLGLYGLLSYEVTQRTREIGIRMALGARPPDVLRFVVRQGVGLSAVGAVIGMLVALGATRYFASLLYGVRPFDPLTFLAVALLLGFVALAACYIPARRASRVDPLVALRYE